MRLRRIRIQTFGCFGPIYSDKEGIRAVDPDPHSFSRLCPDPGAEKLKNSRKNARASVLVTIITGIILLKCLRWTTSMLFCELPVSFFQLQQNCYKVIFYKICQAGFVSALIKTAECGDPQTS